MTEPCINCPADAAPSWLLCVGCAAAIDEPMVEALIEKYRTLPAWLDQADTWLSQADPGSAQYQKGLARWHRTSRVRERLQFFLVTVLAMRLGYPEIPLEKHLGVAGGEAGWQKFLDCQTLDTVDTRGNRTAPPPLLAQAAAALSEMALTSSSLSLKGGIALCKPEVTA